MFPVRKIHAVASLVVAAGVAACADGEGTARLTAPESRTPSLAVGTTDPSARIARSLLAGGRNSFRVGDSVTFQFLLWDAAGARITDIPVTYRVNQPAYARIDSVTGALVVLKSGAYVLVTATAGSLTGTSQFSTQPAEDGRTELVVAPVPASVDSSSQTTVATPAVAAPAVPALPTGTVARVALWGGVSQVRVGDTVRYSLPMWDASGRRIDGGRPTFTVSRPDLATIDADGLLRVVRSGGSVLVTGKVGSHSASSQFGTAPSLDGQTDLTTAYRSPVARVVLQGLGSSYTVGQTARLAAVAYDSLNRPVSGVTPQWSVDQGEAASIDSTGFLTVKLAPETVTVRVKVGGRSTSGSFVAQAPAANSNTNATTSAGVTRIPATIVRFAGSGATLVSSGIPLTPGLLYPADASKVRVLVNGIEQPVYVEALSGLHANGSLRAVLVQFRRNLAADERVPAVIEVGIRPTQTIARPTEDRTVPDAAILPDSPIYLVGTDIAGATVTAAEAAYQTPMAAQFESDFTSYGDRLWSARGNAWEENYYDRAATYYAHWARTGNPVLWRRGTELLASYRRNYLEANNYAASPHWTLPEGLERHYLVTGDTASRYALTRLAGTLSIFALKSDPEGNWGEGRIMARTLLTQLLTWRISPDATQRSAAQGLIDRLLTNIPLNQSADGGFRFPGILGCDGTLNYMDGMLDDALIQTYTYYRADPKIVTVVKKSADYLWTQWVADAKGFKYMSKSCPTGGEDPTADLNNLMINAFAWTYAQSHDATYKSRADQIFAGGIQGAFLYGSKQFNQHYMTSYHYLAYRMR